MITLRLYTFDQWGNEIKTLWSFTPLMDVDASEIYRESETAVGGEPRRRPYSEREIRTLTLGAGLLKRDADWLNFKRLLHAHKIEWQRTVGTRQVWVPYALDEDSKVTYERVEEVTRLRRKVITLIQTQAMDFTQFETASAQLVGLRESE